ncbi:MAG: hypothetical protein CO064_05865 [Anaerolineae bacterium CG_4_9_14_0_8_um_filter_58_9]|nr:MAG: hypothetical protein CO064_05865 [Anaerolineae bacterium CG_4_9_14_0_8_um_filter_58_9]
MSKKSRKHRRQRRFPIFWVLAIGGLLLVAGAILLSRPGGTSGGGTATLAPIQVQGQAAIRVDRQEINFGDVKLNVQKTFTITVTNVGDQPLRFTEAPYIEVVEGC